MEESVSEFERTVWAVSARIGVCAESECDCALCGCACQVRQVLVFY